MITLHLVEDYINPTGTRSTRHVSLLPGQTCADFVPNDWALESSVAVVNGGRVDMDYRLMEGDDVLIYLAPEWSYLVQIAISFAIGYLMKPDIPDNRPDGPGPKTYGFTGLGNRWGHSATIPILFGSMRVGGHVLGYYNESLGVAAGQQVYIMLGISEGPVHEIAQGTTRLQPFTPIADAVYLDDNDGVYYSGLDLTTSIGDATGGFHDGFMGKYIQRTIGQEVGQREARITSHYTGGDSSLEVDDNSAFFASDTIFIDYISSSSPGDTEFVSSIDANGTTIHLVTPTSGAGGAVGKRVVSYSTLTITGDGTTGTALRFNFHFPQGLYRMNSQGQATNIRVKMFVRVRSHAAGGIYTALNPIEFVNNRIGGYWETFHVDLVAAGFDGTDIDIEIVKVSPNPGDLTETFSTTINLDSVVFQAPGIYRMPGTAVVALHGIPMAQLNGRFPTATVQTEGFILEYPDDDAGTTWSNTTIAGGSVNYRNPAWAALEILRNTRFGLGNFVDDADIDLASFREWAAFCEEDTLSGYAQTSLVDDSSSAANSIRIPLGASTTFAVGDKVVVGYGLPTAETLVINSITSGSAGNGIGITPFEEDWDLLDFTSTLTSDHWYGEIAGTTEARCLCDFYWDEDSTVAEAISLVAGTGRAIIVKTGNKYRAVVDKQRDAVQLVDETNMLRDTFNMTSIGKIDLPNTLDAVFFNRDTAFNRASARVVDSDALAFGEPQKVERIDLKGVTRIGQAYRDAAYLLRKKRLENVRIEFELGLDGLAAEAGDRIEVAHYAMTNGHAAKVIDAQLFSGKTQLKLDDTIPYGDFEPGPWQVRIAIDTDDSIVSSTLNGGGGRGEWVTLDDDYGTSILVGMHCAYGPLSQVTDSFVIQEIGRTEQFQRRVLAVRYDETIYDDVAPETFPVDNGWDAEERDGGTGIGHQGWDDWAANVGGTGTYGEPDSSLTALVHTVDEVDGSKTQKVALSWNAPTIDPPHGEDSIPETFRTSGTYTAATWTVAADSALSDKATEGGGRRWAGTLIKGYEIFIRHPEGSSIDGAWQSIQTVEDTGALVTYAFEEGLTYEFAVSPVAASGWKLPIAKCPTISVLIGTGTGGPGYVYIDDLPTSSEMQIGTGTTAGAMTPALSRAGWLIKEAAAPSVAPPASGMIHYDSTTGDIHFADGTATVNDWRLAFTADKGSRDFRLDNNEKLLLGDTDQFSISYDSTLSKGSIVSVGGSGLNIGSDVLVLGNQAQDEDYIVASNGGGVGVYYNNAVHFLTIAGGVQVNGDISFTGTGLVDGRDVAADGTKLDGIEALAEVNTVDSVNGMTGVVALDLDDIPNGSGAFAMTTAHKTMADNIDVIADDTMVGNISGLGGAPSSMTAAEVRTLIGLDLAIMPRLFGVLQTNGVDAPTLEANSYNIASVSRTGVGLYTFTFSGGLGLTANAYTAKLGMAISTSAQFFVAEILTRTAAVVTIEVRNASTLALADGGDWALTIHANI